MDKEPRIAALWSKKQPTTLADGLLDGYTKQ